MGNSHGSSYLRKPLRWKLTLLPAVLLLSVSIADAATVRVTDMAGRTVIVPGKISKVWSAYPPLTYLIYTLAPELRIFYRQFLNLELNRQQVEAILSN